MPPPSARHAPRPVWLGIALLALLLGACGFQPRGQAPGAGSLPSPIFISGLSPYAQLSRELERQLKIAGVAMAPSAVESAAVLHISRWDRNARLLSVNSRNNAIEYELEEAVQFRLRAPDGGELVGEQTARVTRIEFRPETAVLGSAREAELLRGDMRRELAERVVRRLAAQF